MRLCHDGSVYIACYSINQITSFDQSKQVVLRSSYASWYAIGRTAPLSRAQRTGPAQPAGTPVRVLAPNCLALERLAFQWLDRQHFFALQPTALTPDT